MNLHSTSKSFDGSYEDGVRSLKNTKNDLYNTHRGWYNVQIRDFLVPTKEPRSSKFDSFVANGTRIVKKVSQILKWIPKHPRFRFVFCIFHFWSICLIGSNSFQTYCWSNSFLLHENQNLTHFFKEQITEIVPVVWLKLHVWSLCFVLHSDHPNVFFLLPARSWVR